MVTLKKRLIFLVLLAQTFSALFAGCLATYLYNKKEAKVCVLAEGTDITYLDKDQMESLLTDRYRAYEAPIKLSIGDKEYTLFGEQLNLEISYEHLWEKKENFLTQKVGILDFLISMISPKTVDLGLPVTLNEGLLKSALKGIAQDANKSPTDATIEVIDNQVIKKPGQDGYKLNIEKASSAIIESISFSDNMLIIIDKNTGLDIIEPKITLDYYFGLDAIISKHEIQIPNAEHIPILQKAAELIDGKIIDENDHFDYKKLLAENSINIDNTYEIHDILASTIHVALLKAGMDTKQISKVSNSIAREYLPLGLDVSLEEGNFSFSTSSHERLMMNIKLDGHLVEVSLVGSADASDEAYKLKATVVQEYAPGIIYVEDKDIPVNTEIVTNEGKRGIMVDILRQHIKSQKDELLYTIIYEPVSKIVKVNYAKGDYIGK